jgi:hypothetical protein
MRMAGPGGDSPVMTLPKSGAGFLQEISKRYSFASAAPWRTLFLEETITVARVVWAVVVLGGTALIALPGKPLSARPR